MIPVESKEEVVQRLLVAKQRANTLEIRLLLKGKEDEANKVRKKSKALTRQTDKLLGQLMDEWLGEATQVIQGIKTANAALQTAITKIKNNVEIAQNVVKAIGLIDDVIVIAKGLTSIPPGR